MDERDALLWDAIQAHKDMIEAFHDQVETLTARVVALEQHEQETFEHSTAYDEQLFEIRERSERQQAATLAKLERKQRETENDLYALEQKLKDADTRARRGW